MEKTWFGAARPGPKRENMRKTSPEMPGHPQTRILNPYFPSACRGTFKVDLPTRDNDRHPYILSHNAVGISNSPSADQSWAGMAQNRSNRAWMGPGTLKYLQFFHLRVGFFFMFCLAHSINRTPPELQCQNGFERAFCRQPDFSDRSENKKASGPAWTHPGPT